VSLDELRAEVLAANLALPSHGLVTLTWGNASGVDREAGVVAIKPSGVSYESLDASDIVVVRLADGEVVDGSRKPSTDTPTHLALYREFEEIGGIVHTHSTWATAWAQAQRPIPLLGTTHADLCAHPIPLTRQLTEEEIAADYEGNTGTVLIETISGLGPEELPCALVRGHAPFCWGSSASAAVENAVTLEAVAKLALLTNVVEPGAAALDSAVREKHHQRKHGPQAYYGQR
jgi:L-ribulose-5-phosphate 4-epimerase